MTVRSYASVIAVAAFVAGASVASAISAAAADVTADESPALHVTHVEMLETTQDGRPSVSSRWQPVELPHRWGATAPSLARTVWYRLALEVSNPARGDLAVYLPKVSMNADLWVDGRLAARSGRMTPPLARHWNTPLLFRIAPAMLKSGGNEIQLRVRASDRHDGGLAPFWVGSIPHLEAMSDQAHFWRITMVNMLVACVLALAFVVMIVWARRPNRLDYLYFFLGAIGVAIASLNMTVTNPAIGDEAWEVLVHVALHGGVLFLALFGWQFAGVSTRRLRWVMLAVIVADLIALTALDPAVHRTVVALFSLVVLCIAAAAMLPLVRTLRQRPVTDFVAFGLAATLSVGIGTYDWLVVSAILPYEAPFGLPYVWPILLGAFAWLIAGDYARSQRELAALNQSLEDRIRLREAELIESHERLRAAERAHASAEERARILRDMHDGVGSHLTTALRQLEAGQADTVEVARTLRDSLDHLKLSIDAMTVMPGDINATLAALRYRLAPRLESAGLQVVWNVHDLPIWVDGRRDGFMRHLQFLLFELVSNVLQHARASQLRVSAYATDEAIELVIGDDGCGLAEGVALRSCEVRARSIGAGLEVRRDTPGTEVRIALRRVPAAA